MSTVVKTSRGALPTRSLAFSSLADGTCGATVELLREFKSSSTARTIIVANRSCVWRHRFQAVLFSFPLGPVFDVGRLDRDVPCRRFRSFSSSTVPGSSSSGSAAMSAANSSAVMGGFEFLTGAGSSDQSNASKAGSTKGSGSSLVSSASRQVPRWPLASVSRRTPQRLPASFHSNQVVSNGARQMPNARTCC